MNTIRDLWDFYSEEMIKDGVPVMVVFECRVAFYSGVRGLLILLDHMDKTNVSTVAIKEVINAWRDELKDFGSRLESGDIEDEERVRAARSEIVPS